MFAEIVELRSVDAGEWIGVVTGNHPFPPLWWVPGVSREAQVALMEQSLLRTQEDPASALLGCRHGATLTGMAELRYMNWDSEHFGFPVYRLDNFAVWGEPADGGSDAHFLVEAIANRARELGARAVHSWLPMEAIRSIQAFEATGFRTMDILTTWVFEHGKQKISDYPDKCVIRGPKPGDEEILVQLAREAYTDTPDRFHSDPKLPTDRSNELYAEWIKNSFSGRLANHIVVAEVEGKPAGYTTLKWEGDHNGLSNVKTGGLILSAVAPWAGGKGVYTSMINGGLRWFAEQGAQVSHLGTQVNNYPVQRAWVRLGFRLAKAGPSLHLWLGD